MLPAPGSHRSPGIFSVEPGRQMMSEQPVWLCHCGHCQQHWLYNGWVCPEIMRPVDTIRTEQPPEDPWQSMEDPWAEWAVGRQDWWRGRARGTTDVQNSWNDPWLEQDPWSEASAPNGTWRRPREGWRDPRDARDPWEESTPAVPQREGWLDWRPADPWGAPADPWGDYADPWADTCPEEWLLQLVKRKWVCLKMGYCNYNTTKNQQTLLFQKENDDCPSIGIGDVMVRHGMSLGSQFRSGPQEAPTRAPGPWTRRRLHNRQQDPWPHAWGGARDGRLAPDGRPGPTKPLKIPPVDGSMG